MICDKSGFLKNIGQEEIATKQPRYWNEIINRHNNLIRKVEDLKGIISEQNGKIARLENELRLKNNLLKTYDKKVEELIVECHEVTKRTGRWEYSDEELEEFEYETSKMDFVEENTEITKRIVARDWGIYVPEHDAENYECAFHIQDMSGNYYNKNYCVNSEGPVFWWIDIDGEEHSLVEGEIVSVKNRDGEVLYELSKEERENLVIGNGQILDDD